VFFGTPRWAVPSLRALLESPADVAAVVTNPDRPSGRGMELTEPPVKLAAAEAGIRVLQPAKARDPEFHDAIAALDPDVAVVVAYGKILPGSLLDIPPLGFVNVHFSLLPEYRGAAPVQRAIMDGVEKTGVSIMVLTEGMDEGPVLATETVEVGDDDTAGAVGDRLADMGGRLLVTTLGAYASGHLTPVPQDDGRATYAPKVATEEARIDWNQPASRIHNLVRGLNPAPGAWTTLRGDRLKVFATRRGSPSGVAPGGLRADGGLIAGTSDGGLELVDVQLAGKRRMGGGELARGLRLSPEDRLQ
jgi:methionyl-tRNA formyltransferase